MCHDFIKFGRGWFHVFVGSLSTDLNNFLKAISLLFIFRGSKSQRWDPYREIQCVLNNLFCFVLFGRKTHS